MAKRSCLSAILSIAASQLLAPRLGADSAPKPEEIEIHRASGPITVDGDLSDPGWAGAARFNSFLEAAPGNNVAPPVATVVFLAHDRQFLYVALICSDPDPSRIRAPHVD